MTNENLEPEETNLPIDLHQYMDTLFELHDNLFDISEGINSLYAVQIVSFVTVSFVLMLFGFFFETKVSLKKIHILTKTKSFDSVKYR